MPRTREGKELSLINMADAREIEYTLVPNTKGNSDLWNHFNLRMRKTDGRTDTDVGVCKQCNSVVRLSEDTSNMSAYAAPPSPIVAWVTCWEQTEGRQAGPHQTVYRYFIPVWT